MIEYFDLYTQIGWRIIPVKLNSKIPIFPNWNKSYNYDLFRDYVKNNKCNIGLLLGDVVDVEADDEKSNALLEELVGSQKHLKYRSNKSTHHLFLTPCKNLTREVYHGIEFRGKYHQSLLPPSIVNGKVYSWERRENPSLVKMPDRLFNFFNRCRKSKNKDWKKLHCVCGREIVIRVKDLDRKINRFGSWKCNFCIKGR